MSRAVAFGKFMLELGLIALGAAALLAGLLALAVGALEPEQWPTAFLHGFAIFAPLLFAAFLLLELVSRVDVGNPPPLPDRDAPPRRFPGSHWIEAAEAAEGRPCSE